MKFFDKRALAGSDGTHEVNDLATLLSLQGGGMKITDDLCNGFFNAEEFIRKEIVNFDGLVFVESLDAGIISLLNVLDSVFEYDVVDPGVGELCDSRLFFDFLKIA